jgi:hypothetical protein
VGAAARYAVVFHGTGGRIDSVFHGTGGRIDSVAEYHDTSSMKRILFAT